MEADGLSVLRISDLQRAIGSPVAISNSTLTLFAMRLAMSLDNISSLAASFFNTLCVGAALIW